MNMTLKDLRDNFPQALTNKSKNFINQIILDVASQQISDRMVIEKFAQAMQEYMKIDATGTTESDDSLADIMHKQHKILIDAIRYAQEHGYIDEKLDYIIDVGSSRSADHVVSANTEDKKE